ncbi:MAG: hypothetical protein QOG10_5111 [Kribbellaceae bacterium]|jgi:hypothetical protein|nr:hypothetical protein [Kribbellaceae bacterium]
MVSTLHPSVPVVLGVTQAQRRRRRIEPPGVQVLDRVGGRWERRTQGHQSGAVARTGSGRTHRWRAARSTPIPPRASRPARHPAVSTRMPDPLWGDARGDGAESIPAPLRTAHPPYGGALSKEIGSISRPSASAALWRPALSARGRGRGRLDLRPTRPSQRRTLPSLLVHHREPTTRDEHVAQNTLPCASAPQRRRRPRRRLASETPQLLLRSQAWHTDRAPTPKTTTPGSAISPRRTPSAVTLTVTQAGYLRGADGGLDRDHPQVRADAAALRREVRTVLLPRMYLPRLHPRRRPKHGRVSTRHRTRSSRAPPTYGARLIVAGVPWRVIFE